MTLKYLISDQVIFDSDAHHLISLTSDTVKVTLHTPASQCLLLLLQNQGEVLTQKFLFENIWGKNGAFVSANTLYQNIAIVRKGLKSAGIGDDIVQTIPKTGIKFTGHATLYFAKETDPQEMREASPLFSPFRVRFIHHRMSMLKTPLQNTIYPPLIGNPKPSLRPTPHCRKKPAIREFPLFIFI
jgi:DNA-binding winged helix-turn-helix (wHTH) protein